LRSGNGASITNNGTFNDQNAASNYVSAYYGGTVTFTNNGTYEKTGEGSTYIQTDFTNAGNIHALQGQLVFQGTFANTTGSVNLSNGAVVSVPSAISFGSGSLTGSGTLIAPGGAICSGLVEPGNLSITGDLTLQSAATLSIALKGASSAGLDYGLLSISGTAALDGTLSIQFGNGFENSVATTDMFTVLTAGSTLSGSFSNVINGARLTTSDGFGSFLVYYGSGSSYGTDKLVLMDFQPVPEPSTWVLLSLGLGALCLRSRHRRRWL